LERKFRLAVEAGLAQSTWHAIFKEQPYRMNLWTRRLHRLGALVTALPLLLVITSGLLLQLKKQLSWVQPVSQRGSSGDLRVGWENLLATATNIPEAQVTGWKDIRRVDVTPSKGLVKLICNNHWEIQVDAGTGAVLSSTYRRSDWLEQIHDGSYFADWAKLWVFFPNGLILLGLWLTGLYLWWLPVGVRLRKRVKTLPLSDDALHNTQRTF
jgi:uncharacterized iron-regulated membrane protein